jgi:hypothetical protein
VGYDDDVSIDYRRFEVVDEEMAKVLRAKTGAERLSVAWGMYSGARRMLLSHLRFEHPDWSEQEVKSEASRRLSHGKC